MLLAVALLAGAQAAGAQSTDSTVTPSVLAPPADSLAARGGPAVAPFAAAPGRALTPVPAVTAGLSLPGLLADRVGAFDYALGAPGRSGGASLEGADPDAAALTLDGFPLTDPVTDAPRLDLVPLALAGPLRQHAGLGRAAGWASGLRDLRLAVPVTELRFLGGQEELRHISASHAQTRRPPAFVRGGSPDARLTATFHAASRAAAGPLAGATLRHTDALGRLLLTRPGLAAEAGVRYADRTEGARSGVVSATAEPDGVFAFRTATPREADALRRTLRTEGWLRLRLPLLADPIEAGVSGTVQRLVYTSSSRPDVRVHTRRAVLFAEQPLALGAHRLAVRAEGHLDAAPDTASGAFTGAGGRLSLHGAVSDSLRLGAVGVRVGAGLHRVGTATWPSASAGLDLGPVSASVRLGGRARPRVAETGLARIGPSTTDAASRLLAGDVALALRRGDLGLGLQAFASAERDGWHLVGSADTLATFVTVPSLVQGGLGGALGWRERARRGVYARLHATARTVAGPPDGVRPRIEAALPRLWGGARLGVRAEGVGDGVLDLDLAAVGRGWTAFRSRSVEPVTGLLVLPEPGAPLGLTLPARGTLGLEATATFSARASLFVRYDHALGDRLYDGALVVQGEPLAPHVVRFGVFWALLD